jgi:MbtH protein
VLINDEEQYSIWLASNEIPAGWWSIGLRGSKAESLAYVELHWIVPAPKSLRT